MAHRSTALLASTALTIMLAGCAGSMGHMPPIGGLYAGAKGVGPSTQAQVTDGVRPGSKEGIACALGVLGLASWGDMSLATAKKNGGITRVATVDYKATDILGIIFQKHCTVITGEEGGASESAGIADTGTEDLLGPAPAPAPAPAAAPAPAPAPGAPPPPPPPGG
jgi:hypothetical protein